MKAKEIKATVKLNNKKPYTDQYKCMNKFQLMIYYVNIFDFLFCLKIIITIKIKKTKVKE